MSEQLLTQIPTADQRLEGAKSALALLMLITNAMAQSDDADIADCGADMHTWAWSRLSDVCRSGYLDIEAAVAAIENLQVAAPDVAEGE
jgi:hypothetical protein